MTKAHAIVTDGAGNFSYEEIEIADPQRGEVLVEIKASGVCHTDFDSMSWGRVCVMGHEGAGIVQQVGIERTPMPERNADHSCAQE